MVLSNKIKLLASGLFLAKISKKTALYLTFLYWMEPQKRDL